eukprot:TRINITY_DN6189_c0_g1_i1.p1 TRINITY_DN6189_c0_g1~~TRINITY_DN6189_c0_g1_i1.p1  ORF type:complete len:195 (-),score=33.34 TRINITY_DN6189_c0_g1_i1:95-679(-)
MKNLKNTEIIMQCVQFSLRDHSNYDSFIFYFSGHGGLDVIYGHDVDMKDNADDAIGVEIRRITDYFQRKNCESLTGKPKIFLWDCCRGNAIDKAKGGWADLHDSHEFHAPKFEDFLYGYSSAASYVSYPGDNTTQGLSLWTYFLTQRLLMNHGRKHFSDLLVRVQRDLGKYIEEKYSETSSKSFIVLQKDFHLM